MAALASLGLRGVNEAQVAETVAHLFPGGTDGVNETDVIRAVFQHLRRTEAAR